MYDHKITGIVIQRLRIEKGLTQEVLSGLAGISRSHLAMIENGQMDPKVATLWKISEALGMRLSELFAEIEKESSSYFI